MSLHAPEEDENRIELADAAAGCYQMASKEITMVGGWMKAPAQRKHPYGLAPPAPVGART
jgi:hypothetical protein